MSFEAASGHSEARGRILVVLRALHGRFRAEAMGCAARRALPLAGSVALAVAVAYVLFRGLLFWMACAHDPLGSWAAAAVVVTVFLAVTGVSAIQARVAFRSLAAVAETIDRRLQTSNRLATALEFSARRATAFEAAAVEDAIAWLPSIPHELRSEAPATAVSAKPFVSVALALGIVVLAAWIPRRAMPIVPGLIVPPAHEAQAGRFLPKVPAVAEPPAPEIRDAGRSPSEPPRTTSIPPGSVPADRGGSRNESGERRRASGRPGAGRSVAVKDSKEGSEAEGEPTEGSSPEPLPDDGKKAKERTKKKPESSTSVPPKKQQREDSGATAGQAGSGGGAMSPIRSAFSQRDRSSDDPLAENPSDERIEDEIEAEEARGGTQPTTKDRRGASSRDLSISGPGEGGDGRGGPSLPKKSRGTASLVLGVPVPDFVRGLLNPGTTKVTHERVEPVPADAPPHPALPARARTRPEPIVSDTRHPPSLRDALKRFFLALREGSPVR